jgi:rod shape-determining protein MreB
VITRIGLDLGYANITLSDVSAGIFREPAVALIDKDTRRIISVGEEALSQGGDNTPGAVLVRPFKNGILFDRQITNSIIVNATRALPNSERIRCVLGVPSDILPKQEQELFAMLNDAGISDCYSVNRSVAALLGAGFSPLLSIISVNIGASATEITVYNDGQLTYVAKTMVGGEDFDKAVKQYIFEQGGVTVSGAVAMSIKEKLGSVWRGKEADSVDIEGVLSMTGNRVKMTICTEDVVGVFEKPLHKLLMAVAEAIKKIPLDNVEKTFKNGIVLTGGGAMLHGLDKMMENVLGVPVIQPDNAIDSVAKGLNVINTMIPIRGRSVNKNITSLVAKYYEDEKEK